MLILLILNRNEGDEHSSDASWERRAPVPIPKHAFSAEADARTHVLRKAFLAIFTDVDGETLAHEDTETVVVVINFLKEAILGIVLAFTLVSLFLFLDYYLIVKIPMARNARRAAFAAMNDMNDADTLTNLEEGAGLKFLRMDEYDRMAGEIAGAADARRNTEAILRKPTDGGFESKMARHSRERSDLFVSLDLDKFCESCMWSKSQTIRCDERVEALKVAYGTTRYRAMQSAMKKKSCSRAPEEHSRAPEESRADAEKRKIKEEELMKFWEENEHDFCSECDWEEEMSCGDRADFLNYRYSVPLDRAKATAMGEAKQCSNSYNVAENEKLKRFCAECVWGKKLTCQQRLEYLTYTYKITTRKAKLNAVQKTSCLN